jgi:hypothetical protein
MITAVHIADVGPSTALSTLTRTPRPRDVDGLRWASTLLAAPLRSGVLPAPTLKRVCMLSFWDDDDALNAFEQTAPVAPVFRDGFHARLEPLRVHGSWPGIDASLTHARKVDETGPALVLTLGRLRVSQGIRFLRASARAEAAVLDAKGLIWATGLGRPPFVATCSLWRDYDSIANYAFQPRDAAHPRAIAEGQAKPFHKQEAFIRFKPYEIAGTLVGKNPLAAEALTQFATTS